MGLTLGFLFLIFPTIASQIGHLGYFKNTFNKHPQSGELVEDNEHNIWLIESGVKRYIPSWKIVLEKFPEKAQHILRVDDTTLKKFRNGSRVLHSANNPEGYSLFSQTVPFNSDFRIQAKSPLNFGVPGSLTFFVWFWDAPGAGSPHSNLLQATPLQLESLSPILYTIPSNFGKISLFLGTCTTKRKGRVPVGSKINVDVKGNTVPDVIQPRRWYHVALIYSGEVLSLFVDNKLAAHLNTSEFGLRGQAGGAGAIDPNRRVLTFGKVESAKGFTGLISNARAWEGVALPQRKLQLDIAHNTPAPIPKWLIKVVDASLGEKYASYLSEEMAVSTATSDKSHEKEDPQLGSLFKFGQAFVAAPPSDGTENSDWRQSAIHSGISAVEKSKKQMEDAVKKWKDSSEEDLLEQAFKINPCVMLREGWWTYKLCFKQEITQSHVPSNPTENNVVNSLGRFESAENPIFLVDPSLLHQNCKAERKLFCPHISFEDAKAMVYCLYDSRSQLGMGNRCASIVVNLKLQSSVIPHHFRNGDVCSPSNFARITDVTFMCCRELSTGVPVIKQIVETRVCVYNVKVCVPNLCPPSFLGMEDTLRGESEGALPTPKGSTIDKKAEIGGQVGNPEFIIDENANFFLNAEVEETSSWNPTSRGRLVVDGKLDTFWKSGVHDPNAELIITPNKVCESGISKIRLHWLLAPDGYTIFASSITGEHFQEISSVAASARKNRVDDLNGWPMSNPEKLQKIKLKIDKSGPFTANSLFEIWAICNSNEIVEVADKPNIANTEISIEANGATSSVREYNGDSSDTSIGKPYENLVHWTTDNESLALQRIGSGIRDNKMAQMIWMMHFMHKPKISGKNYREEKLSFEKSRHSLAYNFLRGDSWPKLETDLKKQKGRAEKTIPPSVQDFNDDEEAVAEERNEIQYSYSRDVDVSAAMYHAAALDVVGPENNQKHPKPAERIYLSKASKELLKQHDGDDSDVAVFQKDRAEQGDMNAKMWVAGRYYHGLNGFPQDRPRAAEAFRAAAELGNAEGAYNYAVMRFNGQDGRPADPTEAHRYFQIAADKEFSPALNGIGVQHMQKKDYRKAAEFFRRAAATLSPDGHFNLGSLYRDGKGLKKSYRMAILHYLIASNLGHHRAMFQLGEAYFHRRSWISLAVQEEKWGGTVMSNGPNNILSVSSWSDKGGNVNMTGYIYEDHIVLSLVQKSPRVMKNTSYPFNHSSATAVKFLRHLTELGVAQNITKTALKLWNTGDFENAELLYEEAATMGMVDAISNVAWIQRGKQNALDLRNIQDIKNLVANSGKAPEVWERNLFAIYRASQAAMEGSVDDALLLASAYEQTGGTNIEKAMEYFEYAAEKNNQEGLFRIGLTYSAPDSSLKGRFSRNDSKAEEYFRRGVELGGYGQIPSLVGLALLRFRRFLENSLNQSFNNFEELEQGFLFHGAIQYVLVPIFVLLFVICWVYLSCSL